LLGQLAAAPAHTLETDQYYAWGRPLADSGDALNAKVNLELLAALDDVNAKDRGQTTECREILDVVKARYTMFIFQRIELWAARSETLSRIPASTDEEFAYRRNWIYRDLAWYDLARSVPPSPTIQVDGIRFGTDKLSHFFSEGHWYYGWYEAARRRGATREEAEELAVRRGVALETTVLGGFISGVMSVGDLEANHQGLRFYESLCEGDQPALELTAQGWVLRTPFDLRPYLSPEWDESYAPNVVRPGRWDRIRPAILTHCPMLNDPSVVALRKAYAARDRETFSERVVWEMVEAGELADPKDYSLDHLCAVQRAEAPVTGAPVGSSP
jgi:hypothetical protein